MALGVLDAAPCAGSYLKFYMDTHGKFRALILSHRGKTQLTWWGNIVGVRFFAAVALATAVLSGAEAPPPLCANLNDTHAEWVYTQDWGRDAAQGRAQLTY